jgi:hypothetical protein
LKSIMEIHDTATTRRALPFNALTGSLEAMFIAGCEPPLRHTRKIDVTDPPALVHGSAA